MMDASSVKMGSAFTAMHSMDHNASPVGALILGVGIVMLLHVPPALIYCCYLFIDPEDGHKIHHYLLMN